MEKLLGKIAYIFAPLRSILGLFLSGLGPYRFICGNLTVSEKKKKAG